MRFGFDFDNTIVGYDQLFYKVAMEQGVVPETTPVDKNAVRDFLRVQNNEDIWTEMQGYVYGARMQEAEIFPDALDVMTRLRDAGHELFIISHKTKRPYKGSDYDLHGAARSWITSHLIDSDDKPLLDDDHIFFNEHKEEKIKRIGTLSCDIFLDDLPEILLHASFPPQVGRYLLSKNDVAVEGVIAVANWKIFYSSVMSEVK